MDKQQGQRKKHLFNCQYFSFFDNKLALIGEKISNDHINIIIFNKNRVDVKDTQDSDQSIQRGSSQFKDQLSQMLSQQVHQNPKIKTLGQYLNALKTGQELSKIYSLTVQNNQYQFCKLKSIPNRKGRNSDYGQELSYLALSQVFIILSPQFLNGLGVYLQTSSNFSQSWKNYIKRTQQQTYSQQQLFPKNQYTSQLQQFLTIYLQSNRNQSGPKILLKSLLQFNYFSVIDIVRDHTLHAQLQNKTQYSNFYQLYIRSSDLIQERIISKMIGSESYFGKYSQLSQSKIPPLTYCIKYNGESVAMLYMYILRGKDVHKKIKNKDLLNYLVQKGHSEVLYISTIYILPKYKRKGHGKNIFNVLKKNNVPIVLCSAANKQTSGLSCENTNGQFYLKIGFQQFYSVQVQATDPLDKGCLSPKDQRHQNCSLQNCCFPTQIYKDESYYVYCP